MSLNLATATFSGKVARIAPTNSKYEGNENDRRWYIWLEVSLAKDKLPIMVKFSTIQQPLPYLIAHGRIYEGFEMSVMGNITNLGLPSRHTDGKQVIFLTNAIVPVDDIYFEQNTTYTITKDRSVVTA